MKLTILILLMMAAGALATTHVNISFSQGHSKVDSKTTELLSEQAQLKASDDSKQFTSDDQNSRFARIQVDDQRDNIDKKVVGDVKSKHEPTADHRSGSKQEEKRPSFFRSHLHNQQRSFNDANLEVHQNHGQFRNLSPQDIKNMEFERYIQSYHSGPTVETVYESAKPEMQHTLTTSPVNERSQRVIKLERQVALTSNADSTQSPSDVIKPTVSDKALVPSTTSKSSSSSSSSLPPLIPSHSVSSTSGNSFKVKLNQNPSLVGNDGLKFDLNYNKPNYNDHSLKNNDGDSDTQFKNHFPPSVENLHSGYGDFYNNVFSRQQVVNGYHPVEQRPSVTKTIQIAQPAIKAKKYEVRHPAIQKEFYDIEERVIIKPAGTVVVELERPSAKILKEETTLPLGHPHPALASAYTPNRNAASFSNIIYSNAESSSANHPNKQYIPQHTYNNQNIPDHQSSIASSFTYDRPSKELSVKPNQNKPNIETIHFSAAGTVDASKPQSRERLVVTDERGNQHELSPDQYAYSWDETDKARGSVGYEDNGRSSSQANISPERLGFLSNHDRRDDFYFDAEYINTSGNTNLRKENKPVRLQDISSEQKEQQQPIIKHEHKIVLSPSQHNIYLRRNQEMPKIKFLQETADVPDINPYLRNHHGPVVVYTPAKPMAEVKYVQMSEPVTRGSTHSGTADNSLQYSAAYAQMRQYSGDDGNKNERQHTKHTVSQQKPEKFFLEDKNVTEVKKPQKEKAVKTQASQAHIEIQIPNQSDDDNKAIFVGSTIRPILTDNNRYQEQKLEISVTNNGEPREEQSLEDDTRQSDERSINNVNENLNDNDNEHLSNIKSKLDCHQFSDSVVAANNDLSAEKNNYKQKFMRIVAGSSTDNVATSTAVSSALQTNIKPRDIDVNLERTTGNLSPTGSRVIASTTASKESSGSESFNKRRIVVNHPFQTVREVVEHEPYTKYHRVQVNEPASPALYQSANYY